MWVALRLICKQFTRLKLREVEEDVCNLQWRQHLGCGRILVFYRSVCAFLVIDGEEDDLVAVDGATPVTTLEGYWLLQRRMVEDPVVEIGRQCCWHDDNLAGARVKMVKIGGRDITRDRVGWWHENEGRIAMACNFHGGGAAV
ncbi:hypothetical protein V8G54_029571 [Vigna mungo]|uniref:Uncharacterized protein n=1 Tax=Vigna mungo TaxID=3915 RepID=A0AAQ3RMR8_VIGMU